MGSIFRERYQGTSEGSGSGGELVDEEDRAIAVLGLVLPFGDGGHDLRYTVDASLDQYYGIVVVAGIIRRCFFQCLAARGEDRLKFDELSGVCVVGYENFRTALALDRGNKLTEGGKALPPRLRADEWTDAIWAREEGGQVGPV